MRCTVKRLLTFIFLALASASPNSGQCVPASTAAGALDTCFGNGGKVTTDVTPDRDFARALAIQPDGKIVVAGIAGFSATSNTSDFLVIRYNTDGSLDTTFDGDGIRIVDYGLGTVDDDYCRGVVIQPDGKIVVSGRALVTPTSYAAVVMRFNPDGSFDNTFDGDGKAQFELTGIIQTYALVLQPDGRIIVGGTHFLNNIFTGLIVRFNPNGSLDSSFASNGRATGAMASVFSMTLQTDGKIVAAGSHGNNPDLPAFAITRLHSDGATDALFGTGGLVTYHPTFTDQNWFVRVRFDHQIFIGGHSSVKRFCDSIRQGLWYETSSTLTRMRSGT